MTTKIEDLSNRSEEEFQKRVAKLIKANEPDDSMALVFAGIILYMKKHTMNVEEWLNRCPDFYHDAIVMKSLIELGYV